MRFRTLKKQSKQENRSRSDVSSDNKNNQKKTEMPKVAYAKYTDRVKATITDMFMIYMPILYIVTYVILNGKEDFQTSQLAQLSGVLLYGLIYAFLLSKFGQTPGKKAYSIKVVDSTSFEQISFLRALWRFIAFIFSATILLGVLLPFYRRDKKALHDLLAKTSVIAC